ncbi:MAG: hypothetical protein ABI569_06475 [Casimicrobiaceae bacterium]
MTATLCMSIAFSSAGAAPDLNQHGLTGSWYEPATDGQGFEIEVYPDFVAPGTGSVFVSWFTYDTVAGGAERQRWYTLGGSVTSGQQASLTIYQNTAGNFNALPVTDGVVVGTATLSFDSCTSGQLAYSFTDGSGRSGTIPLTRLTIDQTCSTTSARPTNADFALSGNWYVPALSGQGFTVEVNPGSGLLFFAWYTYAPAAASAGAAGQRWYTASSSTAFVPGSRSFPVTIYETTGGVFDAPTTAHPVSVGSGTMAFQTCASATLSFTFTSGSGSGSSGTIALSRIGPVPQGCAPLSVGGAYPTTVSLVPGQNTCGTVTVQNAVTTVTHTPGTHAVSLTHAGNTYTGTLEDDGRFATAPKVLTGGGSQFTITIDGSFTLGGFTATVRVDQNAPAPACFYLVDWVGVRS